MTVPQERKQDQNLILDMLGLSSEDQTHLKDAQNVLEQLNDAGALVTLITPLNEGTLAITISHTRDVADDTDTFIQKEAKQQQSEVGWIIPLEDEGKPILIIIDTNFNASVHFIQEQYLSSYRQSYTDWYTGGKTRVVLRTEVPHIHTDGAGIPYEDPAKRLVPTNPDHIEKIDEWVKRGLSSTREQVVKSMNAQKENRSNVLGAFANFGKEISPPPPAEPQ